MQIFSSKQVNIYAVLIRASLQSGTVAVGLETFTLLETVAS